uniref:Uncharacterized protein n=1 Tax=Anguilla anguilla TaxID=7936 RepID=A0A0E9XAI2_ANGAN
MCRCSSALLPSTTNQGKMQRSYCSSSAGSGPSPRR